MSDVQTDNTSVRAAVPLREVRVVNWPLRDEPLYVAGCGALCMAVGMVAGIGSTSGTMGLLSALSLWLAFWKLWIPVVVDLSPGGLTWMALRRRRHVAWRQMDSVQHDRRGVLLSGRNAGRRDLGGWSLYLPWRHHAHLVADFYAQYAGPPRDAVRVPDTSPR